jgi:hypothetical protein
VKGLFLSAKRLSERSRFKDALILRSDYFANPGVNGEVQLGVLSLKSVIQVWAWAEEYAELISEFPAKTPWREIVEHALNNETFMSAVYLNDIQILNDLPPFGRMLGFAITENDEDKACARLLLCLSDDDLLKLETFDGGLYNQDLLSFLTGLSVKLDDEGIDIEDIPTIKLNPNFNYDDLESAFELAIKSVLKAQKKFEKQLELKVAETAVKLKPFDYKIKLFVDNWTAKHSMSRYPGSSATCYMRLGRSMEYLRNYILTNNRLPNGKHTIPAGQDCFGSKGTEFELDFDSY